MAFQSRFEAQIRTLREQGVPLRKIAEMLNREHGLSVTYNGTTGVRDGKPVYMEYAKPDDTPGLARWIPQELRKEPPGKQIGIRTEEKEP